MSKRTGKADPRARGPQVDKWGYLNNPRWAKDEPSTTGGNLIGGTGWNPSRHLPCGHWHKRAVYVRNIAVPHSCYQDVSVKKYTDRYGNEQLWCPFILWMDLPPCGFLALVYDTGGRVWVPGTGMVYKDGTTLDEAPLYDLELGPGWSTVDWDYEYNGGEYDYAPYPVVECIDENFWAYSGISRFYSDTRFPSGQGYGLFVWVVKDGIVSRKDVFVRDTEYDWIRNEQSSMAIMSNGTIAVVALYETWDATSIGVDRASVFISNNYGNTWTEHILMEVNYDTSYLGEMIKVGKDSDGYLYVMFEEEEVGTHVFRSFDSGASWLLVNTLAIPSPPEDPGQLWGWIDAYFDDSAQIVCDPFYQVWNGASPQGRSVDFWRSTNRGDSFTLAIENMHIPPGLTSGEAWEMCGFGVHSSLWFVTVYANAGTTPYGHSGIWRSADDGVTWTKVYAFSSTFYQKWFYWQNYRHDGEVWVWAGGEFYTTDDSLISFLLSKDNGVTWTQVKSPVAYIGSFTQIPIYSLEPQVWTLPFGSGYTNNF